MNDYERAQKNMGDVVDDILVINNAEWSIKTVFATIVIAFRALKTRVQELLLITERDDTGIAKDKADSRSDLIGKGYRICRAIFTYASSTGNDSLANRVDNSISSLQAKDDDKLIAFMTNLHTIADDNATALADYDILPADITALEAAITDFTGWKADPTTAKAQRTSASEELSETLREMVAVLSDRMDPAMYLFENSGTSFYADYFNGRNIIDPGGADAQTQSGTQPAETSQIVNLPFTNLGPDKDVRIKCLTPGTNFEVYCGISPSSGPEEPILSVNDVISPVYTTTALLGWSAERPYLNIHFPALAVAIEWEVKVG